MSEEITRRNFIKTTSAVTTGLSLGVTALSAKSYGRIMGANDRVNFAVAGVRSRGAEHIKSISVCKNAAVTHVVDVDQRYLEQSAALVLERSGTAPVKEKDIRVFLESKDVDAITIATPEHWHAPMAILGMQAGKHVYVEKPCSHNPAETDMLIQTQKKTGMLVQMGNQQRSSIHTQEAMRKIHDGIIGRAYYGRAWYSNKRPGIGIGQVVPVPDTLDWDLWQGPAPRRPYKDNVHPYNWHWFWNWGTGETLNNGTHEVDLCLWALDVKYPKRVKAAGGRYHFNDDWEFYDTLLASFEYDDKMITWEGKSCNRMQYFGRGRGATIHGTKGTVLIGRNGYEIYDNDNIQTFVYEKPVKDATTGLGGGGPMTDAHFQNLTNAIRMGEKLNSPIEEGSVSVTILLLSNIAWKTGRTMNLDPKTAQIQKDNEAMKLWGREYEKGWEPKV
ncbi:Gfo/Idh/MocA family oxidoreductase [candidate division KSB1 bacterium]|nr:Gfo/Idh/MocA family oxidoreductase [candidate division KSB1 bacterium]